MDSKTRREIEDIVRTVFAQEFEKIRIEISMGFVEAIDWYSETLAAILTQHGDRHRADYMEAIKKMRESPERPHVKGFTG